MAERRGMGEAMTLSPEKMAFIKGGFAPGKPAEPEVPLSKSVVEPPPPTAATVTSEPITETTTATAPGRSRPRRPVPKSDQRQVEPIGEGFYGQILVPLTTRLQPRTADALRRACLEQKLARKTPNTHQEIVEIALSQWLQDHNFLD